MWIRIKEGLYNLDHISHMEKMVDECESYKNFCIKIFFKNAVLGFKIIDFENEQLRDEVFELIKNEVICYT